MDVPASLRVEELSTQQLNAAVALLIAAGTLYCFLGYRTLKFVIGLTGFLIAGITAATLVNWVTEGHLLSMTISLAIGGFAGALALLFLYNVGVFLIGLVGSTIIAYQVLYDVPESWGPVAILGIGVAGGLVALLIERPVVTVATAAIGAWLLATGVAYFTIGTEWMENLESTLNLENERLLVLGAWSLLTLIGAFTQFSTQKKMKGKKK